jgi:CheY-like chemotaxis protein
VRTRDTAATPAERPRIQGNVPPTSSGSAVTPERNLPVQATFGIAVQERCRCASNSENSPITDVLRELKYRVLSAPDTKAALTLLKQDGRLNLLLTDIVMPGQNGRELAVAALALRPNLRVIFMTGYSRNAVVHQGRLDEGVELLQKPISQSDLALRVRDVLDRNR